MKIKTSKILFVSIFIAMIFSQFICQIFGINVMQDDKNPSAKTPAKIVFIQTAKAENTKEKIAGLSKDLKRNRNNYNFFYKEQIALYPLFAWPFYAIQFYIFRVKNPYANKVIEGEEGWFFLGNNFAKVLDKYRGIDLYQEAELHEIKNNLLKINGWLQDRNIKLYIAIAPNKHEIYGEFLPIKKQSGKTKLKQLDQFLKNSKLNFINFTPAVKKAKKRDIVYFKTDSHWNQFGAFFAYKTLIKTIKKDFKDLSAISQKDFKIEKFNKEKGGLTQMLKISRKDENLRAKFKNRNWKIVKSTLEIPEVYKMREKPKYETRTINESKNLKVLMFTDSFNAALKPFLNQTFNETICLRTEYFDKEAIKKEKPDIVIIEMVERKLDILLSTMQLN